MNGQMIFYVVIVVLALVFAAIVWVLSSRARPKATLWLTGLGAVVLIGVSIFLYWVGGGKVPGVSPNSPEQSTSATTPNPQTERNRAPNTKWDGLKKIAPGLVPNCLQNASLNEAWDFVSVTGSNEGKTSLVVAFLLLNSETSKNYQRACSNEPNLGTPQGDGAYVALFAQALRSTQLELGKITFSQGEKSYNVTEYLLDDQRLESERWVPQSSPWLTIAGPFPNAPYLLADLPVGEEGRAIGLIALPTGLTQETGGATRLDPNRPFTVYYERQGITLPTR